jgi:hypothetical protein
MTKRPDPTGAGKSASLMEARMRDGQRPTPPSRTVTATVSPTARPPWTAITARTGGIYLEAAHRKSGKISEGG